MAATAVSSPAESFGTLVSSTLTAGTHQSDENGIQRMKQMIE